MTSVRRALDQLRRHGTYAQRYLLERDANCKLEAKHGLSDDPEWFLSGDSRQACERHGQLFQEALQRFTLNLDPRTPKQQLLAKVQREKVRVGRRLELDQRAPEFHTLTNPHSVELELLEVFLEVLKGKQYVPKSYFKWLDSDLNRWYIPPYIHDEGALKGKPFNLGDLSRLVLFEERLQVRWMAGRVLLDIPYHRIVAVEPFWRKQREHWSITLSGGTEEAIDVSSVWNLPALREELNAHLTSQIL